MITNNPDVAAYAARYRIRYESPQTIRGWNGGPILAPWAREELIEYIDDHLAGNAVCIIGWNPGSHDARIAARGTINLVDGQRLGPAVQDIISDPLCGSRWTRPKLRQPQQPARPG